MNTTPFRICLNMIVKNEAKIIERCLSSVAPYISCYVVADTGSTDGTQQIIKRFFDDNGILGQIHEFDFVNFSQSRNKALELAKLSSLPFEYILFCDADMELSALDPNWFKLLTAPVYSIQQKMQDIEYWNIRLIRRNVISSYIGVTHEYLDTAFDQAKLQTVFYIDHACGSNRSDKYRRDAKLLESALELDVDNTRYWFYLAQSWRDALEFEKALDCYQKRAALKGWQEEVFYSLYQIGRLKEQLEHPDDDVLAAYNAATAANPERAEAIYAATRFCRIKELYDRGYEISKHAMGMEAPEGALFSEPTVYTWLLDEFAVNAYWVGQYNESLEACLRLLGSGKLNMNDAARIATNADFARRKLLEKLDRS